MAKEKNKEKDEEQSGGFKLKNIWEIVILHWPWIVLSIIIALGAAYVKLKYSTKVYSHSMKVLIKEENNKRGAQRNAMFSLESLGVMTNSSGFDNEMEIIKSTSVNERAVKALHLYANYHIEGRIRTQDIYNKQAPIIVDMPESQLKELKTVIGIDIEQEREGYKVKLEYRMPTAGSKTEEHKLASLPNEIETPVGTILLQANPNAKMTSSVLHAKIYPLSLAARMYRSKISVSPINKTTTVAVISMSDQNSERAIDYLNQLFESYNEDANEDKNEVAIKTEEFIKERIELIREELDATEIDLEEFKKNNELVDLTTASNRALTGTVDYEKQQVELQTQLNLLDALIEYVNNPENTKQVIPVNLGLTDEGLNGNIKEYNEYVMQRKRLLKSSGEDNPAVERATSYIEEMWPTIKLSLDAIRRDVAMRKNSVDREYAKFNRRITSVPAQERRLTNISRQQEIKANLYLMLLQKQEENYISLASTASKARMINDPEISGQVSMGAKTVYFLALLLGFGLPIGFFMLKKRLRYSIEGRNDIEELTKAAILADIPLNRNAVKKGESIVVHENNNDMMEEAFRGLRTNLRFILDSNEKVIISTSCIPGEGKTFVSTNLAMSLALMGKRVVVVGLDIRKPRLVNLFKLGNQKRGITTFLTSTGDSFELLDEQIEHGVLNKNLDVLPAGIIPPNPSELISREQLEKAINMLKEHYDYVVLDTPPIGLVSDTLSIARLADMTIFVCRADYSPRANFNLINNLIADQKLPKVNLVLNGVDLKKKKYGYYYGYGKYGRYSKYGYGKYGYGKYGHYGIYGHYGSDSKKEHIEK